MVKLRFELVREGESFTELSGSYGYTWTRIPDVVFRTRGRYRFNAATVESFRGQTTATLRYFQPSQLVRVHRD